MKILLIAICLLLSSCATFEANEKFHQLRQEANPNYMNEEKAYVPKDRDTTGYLSCLARVSQRFNQADSRFICSD
jgi:hypothetical protein